MMNRLQSVLLLVCGLALVLALPAAAQEAEPANLRPQWTVGQASTYEFWGKTQKQETATLFGQVQSETTVFLTEGTMSWSVDQVNDDGTSACTMKLLTLKFTITAGEQEAMVVDSENPTGDQQMFDDLVAAMVATPLTVRVNADGTIQAVEGLDEMNQAAGQEARDADIVPEELDFIETASDFATLLAAPAQATPGQTWNAKNTWNHDSIIPGADTQAAWDTTFTFGSLSDIAGVPIATISTESAIDMKVDLSELPEQAPDIDVKISDATGKGEILFDLSRNEVVARNDSMSYTANITVTPPNDQVPPITVQVKESSQSQLLRVGVEQK